MAADAVQTFPLPADLPLGRYLRINLHGKRQKQLQDMQARRGGSRRRCSVAAQAWPLLRMLLANGKVSWCQTQHLLVCLTLPTPAGAPPQTLQFYHAIQSVEAFGRQLSAGEAASLRGWLTRQPAPLPLPGVLPTHAAAGALGQVLQQQQAAEEGGAGGGGQAGGAAPPPPDEAAARWWERPLSGLARVHSQAPSDASSISFKDSMY